MLDECEVIWAYSRRIQNPQFAGGEYGNCPWRLCQEYNSQKFREANMPTALAGLCQCWTVEKNISAIIKCFLEGNLVKEKPKFPYRFHSRKILC